MNRFLRVMACAIALIVPQGLFAQAAPTAAPTAVPTSAPTEPAAPAAPAAPVDNIRSADTLIVEGLNVQAGGLTVEDTVRRAMAVSSTAGEKAAEIEVANARITQTIVQFVPKLGLKASYMRLSEVDQGGLGNGALVGAGSPGPLSVQGTRVVDANGDPVGAAAFEFPVALNVYTLSASLTIPLTDYILRMSDANDGAEASREAAKLALAAAESKVRTDARILYYNWLRAHAQYSLAVKAVERTKARYDDAVAAESVGKLSKADLMRIEALAAQADLFVTQADTLRVMIAAQLAIIMRDKGGGVYTIGTALPESTPRGPVSHEEGQQLIAEGLANRLELKAIDKSLNALEHGESAIDAGSYPRVDAVGELTYANPNQRYFPIEEKFQLSWQAGLVASFSFDAPFMAGAQADELHATAEGIRAQRRGLEAAVVNEVVTAQLDVVKASAALKAGEISVRAAEESYRVATDLFRVGRGTTSDLIDAETDLINAKAAIVNARIDLTIAQLRVDYALGREPSGTDSKNVHFK